MNAVRMVAKTREPSTDGTVFKLCEKAVGQTATTKNHTMILFICILLVSVVPVFAQRFVKEVDNVAALRALNPFDVHKAVLVKGYYTINDGGGGIYTPTNSIVNTNLGTLIVSTQNTAWSWKLINKENTLNVRQFGALGDGVTDDTAAFNSAIDFANTRTTLPTTITIPAGNYVVPSGLTPVTVSDVWFIGENSGSSIIVGTSGQILRWGTGSSSAIVGGGARGLRFKYTLPAASAVCFLFDNADRIKLHDIYFDNAEIIIIAGTSATRRGSAITMSDCYGSVANDGQGAIQLRYGAGLFVVNSGFYVQGVAAPVHPAAMTTVAGTDFIDCTVGSWDTVQMNNCIVERFYKAFDLGTPATFVVQNFFIDNCVFDFIRDNVVNIEPAINGTFTGFNQNNCWSTSWEGRNVNIAGGGLVDGITISDCILPFAGKESILLDNVNAQDIQITDNKGFNANRLAAAHDAILVTANHTNFTISGNIGGRDISNLGITWRPNVGIELGANCSTLSILNNNITGTGGSYAIPTTVSASSVNIGSFFSTGAIVAGASAVNNSAILQADSTTKGILPPRMTKAQRNLIGTPAEGLVVFQTDNTPGLRFYQSGAWVVPTVSADP